MRDSCPICQSKPFRTRKARVAHFLQVYAGVDRNETNAHFCKNCSFVWHELGLTEEQAAKLYSNYRGDEYNKVRFEIEPEYRTVAEDFNDLGSPHYRERAGELDSIFRSSNSNIARTLDFGGDALFTNWLFPNAQNDYFDLSHGQSGGEIRNDYDVIFMFHLLEHVNYPILEIEKAYKLLRPGGLLLTQVPREYDPPLMRAYELTPEYSSAIFNMHEHMNFFSEKTLYEISRISGAPLLGSMLMRWSGLVSFFTTDSNWLDIESISRYEIARGQNMMNDQFSEIRQMLKKK
jgi:SAM-dependent methyltransferase